MVRWKRMWQTRQMVATEPLSPFDAALVTADPADPMLPAILNAKIERAAAYAKAARAPSTRRAYDSDWVIFTAWCAAHGLTALPATPEVVAVFVSDQATAGLNPSTINRRVAAIGHHHRANGYPAPTALPTAGRLAEPSARNTPLMQLRYAICSRPSRATDYARCATARSWRSVWRPPCGAPKLSRSRSSMSGRNAKSRSPGTVRSSSSSRRAAFATNE